VVRQLPVRPRQPFRPPAPLSARDAQWKKPDLRIRAHWHIRRHSRTLAGSGCQGGAARAENRPMVANGLIAALPGTAEALS